MTRQARAMAALAVCLALAAPACTDDPEEAEAGNGLSVVVSFYPLAEVAQRVGAGRVAVSNLTPPGAEPHDFELSTRLVDQILDAELVVFLGRGFQPAVEATVAARTGKPSIDVLEGEELLTGGKDAHGPEAVGGREQVDTHVWLDPTRMEAIVTRVRDALIGVDARGRDEYTRNADAYLSELGQLDSEYAAGLADCERTSLVTSHAAFGYLAARYGLTQDAVAGLSPESEPDPARLAELADEVREEGITTIFYETLVSPKVAEALAREAGVKTAVLNPIEGLTDDELKRGDTYTTVMRRNLAALRLALGCR